MTNTLCLRFKFLMREIMAPNMHRCGLLFMAHAIITFSVFACHANPEGRCIPSEREALLTFKRDLEDPTNILSSWVEEPYDADCCHWHGVVCHNLTGHVRQLRLPCITTLDEADLTREKLYGPLNPSLLILKHLAYLDLSFNSFRPFPSFLGSMKNLRYLNLSHVGFPGTIPHQLGNLSSLQYLDLGHNGRLKSESLEWVSGLSSLQYLDLSWIDLKAAGDWLQVTSTLPSLHQLILSYCDLHLKAPSPPALNFSSLSVLDLSLNHAIFRMQSNSIPEWVFRLPGLTSLSLASNEFIGPIPVGLRNLTHLRLLDLSDNQFNSPIPNWLSNFSHLEVLDLSILFGRGFSSDMHTEFIDQVPKLKKLTRLCLSWNSLYSPIPESIGYVSSLKEIDLRGNKLYGPIPDTIGNLSSLEILRIGGNRLSGLIPESIGSLNSLRILGVQSNQLHGPIPVSIGRLSSVQQIFAGDNKLSGVVTELHFATLTKLEVLYATGIELSLNVSPEWLPPFQLQVLSLDSWKIGPQFPSWLQSQKNLTSLQMSSAGISSSIPNWFWNSFPQCNYYNLSHNQIYGHLTGLPSVWGSYDPSSAIDLSSNKLSGMLPPIPLDLFGLDISNNSLSGSISHFLCGNGNKPSGMLPPIPKALQYLILRDNHLSGKIPNCWMNWTDLKVINFENNKFVGNIPSSMGYIEDLKSLHLGNNHLQGELPTSLRNCINLRVINLGGNSLEGNIPTWIGERLLDIHILILRSNKFLGHIPNKLCSLVFLQILDVSHNHLYGTIPRCFNNFTAMTIASNSSSTTFIDFSYRIINPVMEEAHLATKGNILEYGPTLGLMSSMDLSSNNLSGGIPEELTSLVGLRSLNLSNNFLAGQIPKTIGMMQLIESLDVAKNQLSGHIPPSISNLTFLNYLNLSDNQLTGEIPSGPQLQTFGVSSFNGNKLCGPPLPECNIPSSSPESETKTGKMKNAAKVDGIYVSMALGFIIGFWIVLFPLAFKKSWRLSYFTSLDGFWKKIVSL